MSGLFDRYRREILTLIALTFAVVSFSTFITYKQLNNLSGDEYAKRLSVLKISLTSHVKEYFEKNRDIALSMSSNGYVADALSEFNASFHSIEDEGKNVDGFTRLKTDYKNYLSKINFTVPNANPKRELKEYLPKSESAKILQDAYISKNPFGVNDKYMLYSSSENTSYDKVHKKRHDYFLTELKRFNYYDIFLINLDGDVVYSVYKEFDFATNLTHGVYSNSSLADAYQKALESEKGVLAFSDFQPYEPSYDQPASFLATPVFKNKKKIGVLAIQLSIDDIDRIMTLGDSQKETGLGESGEAYLVGSDRYMRSNSRFMSAINNPLVDETSTTVGIVKIDSANAKKALNGESSFNVTEDYRGVEVLSSYSPIKILDKQWAILVEIDTSEVYGTANGITMTIILTSVALTLSFFALIGYMFLRLILRPMEREENQLSQKMSLKKKELDSTETFLSEYRKAVDVSSIVSKADVNGVITYVNDAFCELSGYSREELIGQPHSIVKHPDTPKEVFKNIWENILHRRVWKGIVKNLKKDGTAYYVKSTIMPILNDKGEIKEFISIRSDVTELTQSQEQLLQQTMDAVTSLPNRQRIIEDVSESDEEIKLSIIQIDKFKEINDFYGIQTGDLILQNICSILKNLVNMEDSVIYRINEDEFAIIDNSDAHLDRFTKSVSNIVSYFDHNVLYVGDDSFNVAVSVGIAHCDKENVLFNAEMTLRKAIESSKSLLVYESSSDVEKDYKNNIEMTVKIKDAIKNDNIVIFAQPIVSNVPGGKEKYECLIRMMDGDKVISPYFFLDIAIKARLYPTLTKIVIEKSFNHFRDSTSEFSINLNIEDILNDSIVSFLKRKIQEYRLGHRLVLELVESEGIENFDEISGFIKEMKKFGCKIAIDDFGTGYSNFEYLMKLNADFIKIDGSLIKNLETDVNSQVVVELIVGFAKRMNIKTIGEFVHNEGVYQMVKDMGIDFTQGYHLGEPIALDER